MSELQPRKEELLIRSPLALRPAVPLQNLPYQELSPVEGSRAFERFRRIIFVQRWKILALMGAAIALAIIIQIAMPKLYEASALVKVDRHSALGAVGQEAS